MSQNHGTVVKMDLRGLVRRFETSLYHKHEPIRVKKLVGRILVCIP
jgi:hypothetical protein